jgi:DNA-binding CsgD family transcriptional regulator
MPIVDRHNYGSFMARNKSLLAQIEEIQPRDPVNYLPHLWPIPFNNETEASKIENALRERIKELNCLYGIAYLSEVHSDSIDDLLKDLVNILPLSWQYPEITSVRILFKEKTFKNKGFKSSKWRQMSRISVYNEPVGEVTIFYTDERPPSDEGPFLKEERALLDAVGERIGAAAMRIYSEQALQESNKQLTVERKALQETNAALRSVLARFEEEKKEIYMNMQANIEKIVIPILHALSLEIPATQRKYIEMIRNNLEDIFSPFASRISKIPLSLTSTEINICNMIRSGLHTKEIAKIRGVSGATISRHRENIRRKLEIANSGINLTTYLQSNMEKATF